MVTAATQTEDDVHQQHDDSKRTVFARAVAVGFLCSTDEMAQAQLKDVDIAPVVQALNDSTAKSTSVELRGRTPSTRFYLLYWKNLVLIDDVLHIR